ncbi:hypothetical protein SAMN05444161_4735 [Rhizobiales bacterium GAS191]|nr:hypothetical protein SAMN05444161_4735 [Rhizobiales bacterium GAS191]
MSELGLSLLNASIAIALQKGRRISADTLGRLEAWVRKQEGC